MNLYQEFSAITRELAQGEVIYVIVGGMALAFHKHPRYTKDIDILSSPEQLEAIRAALERLGYLESSAPWTFSNTNITLHRFMRTEGEEFFIVDVMMGSDDRYQEIIRNAITDKLDDISVKVARKEDLIYLKSLRNSTQDQADIERLQHDET